MPPTTNTNTQPPAQPWWRFGHMWLVVGGPLAVVLASFVTIYLAITRPDPVYTDAKPGANQPIPAMQSRNHAATGGPGGAVSTPGIKSAASPQQ